MKRDLTELKRLARETLTGHYAAPMAGIVSKKSSKGLSSIRPIRDGMELKKLSFPKKLSITDGR